MVVPSTESKRLPSVFKGRVLTPTQFMEINVRTNAKQFLENSKKTKSPFSVPPTLLLVELMSKTSLTSSTSTNRPPTMTIFTVSVVLVEPENPELLSLLSINSQL